MTREVRATTVLLVGALMLRLAIGGEYTRYVRVGMGPILVVAGVLLALVGLYRVILALRGAPDEEHGHEGHSHSTRIGWLLLGPVLALLLVAPPALGSFGVERGITVASGDRVYPLLPANETTTMPIREFDERVADHGGASFGSATVRLTGFVSKASDGDGFQIARYQIACCAADGIAYAVRITGLETAVPPLDSWVTVTGTFEPVNDNHPALKATELAQIPTPEDPYE